MAIWALFLFAFLHSLNIKESKKGRTFILFSSEAGHDLKFLHLSAIAKAKHSVYLASFGYSDADLIKLIKIKTQNHIPVTLLTDRKLTPALASHPLLTLIEDQQSGLMHKKIVLIDDNTLFLGSSNSTETSYKLHHNHMIWLKNELLAKAVKESKHFENDQITHFPLPLEKKEALNTLIQLINQAKTRVYVAIFALTHPLILESLIQAHQRNVKVSIVIDQAMARSTCSKAVKTLQNANIPLFQQRGFQLFHHKCALIDNTFVTGSANWSLAGFGRNREYLLVFSDLNQLDLQQVETFFHRVFRSSKHLRNCPNRDKKKTWHIPYLQQPFLFFSSWTPSETFLSTLPFYDPLKADVLCGLSSEKCASP